MRIVLGLAALALTLSACGSNNTPAAAPAETSSAPTTQDVTVVLNDALPLGVLYNGSGGECTTTVLGSTTDVTITLKDATGTIVGTQQLPESGGKYTGADGCKWPVVFSGVPTAVAYTATVDVAGTKQSQDGTSPITISF